MNTNKVSVCGLNIDRLTMIEALERLDTLVAGDHSRYICFCEGSLLASVDRDPSLAAILNNAGMLLPDGIAVSMLSKIASRPVPQRIPGPQFLPAACEFGLAKGYRHFFYGGDPGVAERLAATLKTRFPGLQIVGTLSPPFRPLTPEETREERQAINAAEPHLLWVALGSPRQERWVAEHAQALNVPVLLAVGAAFDFHSGNRPWAPRWIRAIGMEWLFRMLCGGRRTMKRNLRVVPVAAKMVIRTMLRKNTSQQ